MLIERLSFRDPGYDCRTPETCPHEAKGDHGLAPANYVYAVRDGDIAVSFEVRSAEFATTVEPERVERAREHYPRPANLCAHLTFRVDPDEDPSSECRILGAGPCFVHGDPDLGERFFHSFPQDTFTAFEQPEAFWLALEEVLRERAAHFRARRLAPGEEHVACPRCQGSGKVQARTLTDEEKTHG